MGADLVTWRQPRALVPLDSSTVGRLRMEMENENKVAMAQLESKFERALLRQAEDFKSQLQLLKAETDDRVAVLKKEIKEGMDTALGDIYSRLAGQGDAIDRISYAIGDSASKQDEAARKQDEAARKQDQMGELLALMAQRVLGTPAPLSSSAPAGYFHAMGERGSLERLSTTSGSHPPSPPQVYHQVEEEHETTGDFSAGPSEHGQSVEVATGSSSPHGWVSAPSATLGAASTHEPSRRPGRGLGGGRVGRHSTEFNRRPLDTHSQLLPMQRDGSTVISGLGTADGSGDEAAFRDDGNPMTGAGADNPGSSLPFSH